MSLDNLLLDLPEYLNKVADPRDSIKVSYPLNEILFLAVSAVVSDCSEWGEIIEFGEDKLVWLRKFLPFSNGIPSHDTLNRVFSIIDNESFQGVFTEWANQHLPALAKILINLDGKKLRSSASKLEQNTPKRLGGKGAEYLVQAWCNAYSLCLAIEKVDKKSNEIKAIPLILNKLDIEGSIISIDAIGCQKAITELISTKGGDYVIGLKGNQPTLLASVEQAFENWKEAPENCYTEEAIDHGRLEERICSIIKVEDIPDWKFDEEWPTIKTIIRLKSGRLINTSNTVSYHTRYLISSLELPAKQIAEHVRSHWGIENRLHWCLDVYYGEDKSRKRKGNAAVNFGTVIRIAHNLVSSYPEKRTIKGKRKKCARSDQYREEIMRVKK